MLDICTSADGLHASMDELGIMNKILAVVTDSTVVNTGPHGGAIHLRLTGAGAVCI